MNSYISYETEKREVRIVPVNVLELTTQPLGTSIRESERLKISFFNDIDTYKFLKFFEIDHEEINWKYIKCTLLLYHKDMRFDFKGCFTTSFNLDMREAEINYDHFEYKILNEVDKLLLLSQERHKKLESLGIY